jgi:hypothetical protein
MGIVGFRGCWGGINLEMEGKFEGTMAGRLFGATSGERAARERVIKARAGPPTDFRHLFPSSISVLYHNYSRNLSVAVSIHGDCAMCIQSDG